MIMKLEQTAPPTVPGPRTPVDPREQVDPRGQADPRGQVERRGPHQARPEPRPGLRMWRRRARLLNVITAIGAAGVLTTATFDHLGRHHQQLDLHGGIGGLAWILGSAVVLAHTLGNMLIRPHKGATWRIWASSSLFAALCLAGTTAVWTLEFRNDGLTAVPGTRVDNEAEASRYLDGALGPQGGGVPRIPTGVFMQSVKFSGANDVAVTGVVWQRYAPDVPKALRRGVAFPEAGDSWSAKEVYRTERNGVETIGWNFQATLRERFDYERYPLDAQSVWLRMRPADVTQNAAVVPDFSSYPPWRTDRKYGLDPGFVNGGWRTKYTAFSYVPNDYTSSFGTARYGDERPTPELYFNLGVSRDFVEPLISRLVPVAFIALLIFASLFAVTLHAERRGLTGFSVSGVIGSAVSMLLVITVQHNSVREATGDQSGFVYLEWFYAALYLVIVLVALNALLMSTRFADGILGWRGNLLPKVFYLPIVMGLLLAATLFSFNT